MKWFKFYGQEYLSDPKILTLTASERSCWITLLSYASVNDNENDNGMITFLSERQLMIQAGIDTTDPEFERTEGILKKLEKLQMITIDNANDNAKITILNWNKRQETSLTGYERVKRFREKHQNDNERDNAKITSDKIRIDKNRIEKKKEDKPERHLSFLKKIPPEAIKEFSEKFNVYEQGIKKKAETLYDYCLAKGKQYKDYKAFLRNALRSDFGERPPEDVAMQERIKATREKITGSSHFAKNLAGKFSVNK
jgi:hypothetical protein